MIFTYIYTKLVAFLSSCDCVEKLLREFLFIRSSFEHFLPPYFPPKKFSQQEKIPWNLTFVVCPRFERENKEAEVKCGSRSGKEKEKKGSQITPAGRAGGKFRLRELSFGEKVAHNKISFFFRQGSKKVFHSSQINWLLWDRMERSITFPRMVKKFFFRNKAIKVFDGVCMPDERLKRGRKNKKKQVKRFFFLRDKKYFTWFSDCWYCWPFLLFIA